jgi:hypothetical protein
VLIAEGGREYDIKNVGFFQNNSQNAPFPGERRWKEVYNTCCTLYTVYSNSVASSSKISQPTEQKLYHYTDKKEKKILPRYKETRLEQPQSHTRGRAPQHTRKRKNISPYMRRPLNIHDFATAPLRIPPHLRKT